MKIVQDKINFEKSDPNDISKPWDSNNQAWWDWYVGLADNKNSKCKIQVDGGVNILNAGKLVENGTDVLVAGNFIFKSETPKENINSLKKI